MICHLELELWLNTVFPSVTKTIYYSREGKEKHDVFGRPNLAENDFWIGCYCMPPNISTYHDRFSYIRLSNKRDVEFSYEQKNNIQPTLSELNEKFLVIKGNNTRVLAVQCGNKLWIANTLFNGGHSTRILRWFVEYIEYRKNVFGLNECFLLDVEPTEDVLRERRKKLINMTLKSFVDSRKQHMENALTTSAQNCEEYEMRYRNALNSFHQKNEEYTPILEKYLNLNLGLVVEQLMANPFVDKVYESNGNLIIVTKQVNVGCFNFGKYTIKFNSDSLHKPCITTPITKIEKDRNSGETIPKPFHPYQYTPSNRDLGRVNQFCFGEYNEIFVRTVNRLNLNQSLFIIMKVLTNYDMHTKMSPLEPYLRALGNKHVLTTVRSFAPTELRGYQIRIKRLIDGELEVYAEKRDRDDRLIHSKSVTVERSFPISFGELIEGVET